MLITIDIMFLLKMISLILLGFMALTFIINTFKQKENVHFMTLLFGFSVFMLPFIYIICN